MKYQFEGECVDFKGVVCGDLLHVDGRTVIVVEAHFSADYGDEELFAVEYYDVKPETVKLIEIEEEI